MPGKPKDISGMKFGKLTALKAVGKNGKGEYLWECVCDCGNRRTVNVSNLLLGRSTSCGCSRSTHGMTNSSLFNVWRSMKERCINPNYPNYKNYGGRGITVCSKWLDSFEAFYQWAIHSGYEKGLQIDRTDNEKGYSPDNCRWVTALQNENNRRNNHLMTCDGETHTLAEWSRITGMPSTTIVTRLHRGKTIEEALKTPVQIRKDSKRWQERQATR